MFFKTASKNVQVKEVTAQKHLMTSLLFDMGQKLL